jgi:hypothetical protein
MDLRKRLYSILQTLPASMDIGITDDHIVKTTVKVTPGYAEWVASRSGEDVSVMLPSPSGGGAFSAIGAGRWGVQAVVYLSIGVIVRLVEAGVPEDVALRLLPHELYMALTTES